MNIKNGENKKPDEVRDACGGKNGREVDRSPGFVGGVAKAAPESFDVVDLLPQRLPFILIDRLIYYDPVVARTTFTVREDNPFCRDGCMEEAGLIENIAQTCAAKTGYKEKTEPDRDGIIKIGFIGMIKRLDLFRNPRVGEKIETTVVLTEEVFNATLVEAKAVIGEERVATCEMKIYLTDKAPEVIEKEKDGK
jgi:predicted hotdog family 3-hydroxylacyl-ACP dehydratase